MTGFWAMCTCPAFWFGVVPPPCLVHNPPVPHVMWTATTTPANPPRKGKKNKKADR